MEFVSHYKIPIGILSNDGVSWLKTDAAWFFNFVRILLQFCLDATFQLFLHPPFMLPILLIFIAIFVHGFIWRLLLLGSFSVILWFDTQLDGSLNLLTLAAMVLMIGFVCFDARRNQIFFSSIRQVPLAIIVVIFAAISNLYLSPLIPSPFIFIAILAILSWLMQERWSVVFLTIAGFLFVMNQGYWYDTIETLVILFWSCLFCMGIALPLGIFCAHHRSFYAFLRPVLDLMQTLPAFVYLIPALFFFRIGMVPGLIATFIFVLPTPVRLIYAGILSTPALLLEAGRAFGANQRQLLWKVELPHALPEIRASMTQTIMLSLSMVVISATVGGNGLGVKIYRALQTGNIALGFEAGCVVVVVAVVLDRLFRLGKDR